MKHNITFNGNITKFYPYREWTPVLRSSASYHLSVEMNDADTNELIKFLSHNGQRFDNHIAFVVDDTTLFYYSDNTLFVYSVELINLHPKASFKYDKHRSY